MNSKKPFVYGALLFLIGSISGAGSAYLVSANELKSSIAKPNVISNISPQSTASLASKNTTNQPLISLVSEVSPAIVDITTNSTTYSFFGGPITQEGAGTGMIVSSDGYILTNNHVLPINSSDITVTLHNKKQYHASVVGTNSAKDLALIKINASNLPTVSLGDSSQLQAGQAVIAIGNALGQFSDTVDQGIISGLNRSAVASDGNSYAATSESLTGLIQTDALINPGDSGGPLIDIETGQVIGMDTALASNSQGIGFAIPINQAKNFINQYLQTA